ncbi:MAG: radical SAM protein [Rhodospirillales bacterium]|nr:radical SAM protein [Rhodospirillales bacterium]
MSVAMNLAAFHKGMRGVGPGCRDALWVQGCSIRCPGCANAAFLAHEPRARISTDRLIAHFRTRPGKIDGCSLLGGEPTEQAEAAARLFGALQDMGLSTVLYSGHTLDDLRKRVDCRELLSATDLLIDGPFIKALARPDLAWRGSTNQGLHWLSSRWRHAPPVPDGRAEAEIIISPHRIILNGIATATLR